MPYYVESVRRMIDRYYIEERDHYVSEALETIEDAVVQFWTVKAKIGKKAYAIYIQDGLGKGHKTLYWENYEWMSPSNHKLGKHWLMEGGRPLGSDWKPDPRVLAEMALLQPEYPDPPTWVRYWESCQRQPWPGSK